MSHSESVHRYFAEPDRYLGGECRLRVRRLVCGRMAERTDRSRILDIGCGDGSHSLPLLAPGGRLTLVDFSPQMLERARGNVPEPLRDDVEIACCDFMEFEPPEPYSLVLCLGVLAHVPRVDAALARIAAFVRPGGHALLQITDTSRWLGRLNHAFYGRRSRGRAADGYRLNRLESPAIVSEAAAAGLDLVEGRGYSLAVPGLRRLPEQMRYRLELRFLNSRLSRHGGESLLLFQRKRPPAD